MQSPSDDNNVILSWDHPKGEVDFIKVYRGKNEKSMLTYKSVRQGSSYGANLASVGNQFVKVKIYYKDGSKSAFSNVVEVL